MKKIGIIFAIPLCLTFLAGCGGNPSGALPTTKYEKVQYALNGVEKSLKNQKVTSRSLRLLPKDKRSETDAINAIYDIFPEGTSSQPDFEYDEPPMIQFQYIKKTLEKIGSGFDFGVKYQANITGSIYYDFSTGEETQQPQFKQDYSLDFSLYINIDDSDLITCKTSFDFNYVHEGDTHHQTMYAELFLNYDMKKTDANYKLKLYAIDDCSGFEIDREKHFSAEFDYVDVSNNAINDWGKIGYSTNKAIVLDSSHLSLSNYLSEDNLKFEPTIQLYRDGKKYERNKLNDSQANQACTIACDDLGVNGSDVKYKEFVRQSSTAQPVLKTCYEDFSRIFGRDLAYNIVYTGAKEHDHGEGGEGDNDRVDASWPSQSLIDDGYNDVPGFLSKTATFEATKEYKSESNSYDHYITVLNFQDGDFDRYMRTLRENGFVEDKVDNLPVYFHIGNNGAYDYAIAIYRIAGSNMIVVSKAFTSEEVKEDIVIQNGYNYSLDYSTYEVITYNTATEVANVVEGISGGQVRASDIVQYVIAGSSKSYKIHFDLDKFSGADIKDCFNEYKKLYSGWKVIQENGVFYNTVNGIDVLMMMDKDSSNGEIDIHSFAFTAGSIDEILNGQSQGGGGEGGDHGGQGQDPVKITIYLYEVDEKSGITNLVGSYEYNDGEVINIEAVFGEGKYYSDEGCTTPLKGDVTLYDGMIIFRKIQSQSQTTGTIVIVDANNKEELTTFTDVIGATIKGGAIFGYVLYKDANCSTMVELDEEITVSEEAITLYCKDYSEVDYVTLTINTYINGVLSPYNTHDYGIRRGEIMNNYSSYSFPAYYSSASYFDANFTMTLNGNPLSQYSSDLIALTDNAVLNIYCTNDWCKVYHLTTSTGGEFDIVWESGSLCEGDVVLHGSRYYHISQVFENTATIDSSTTAYTYTLHSVYNGKIITTEKSYFSVIDGYGYSFILDPSQQPNFFLDIGLTSPLMPKEGESEVMFTSSFTLYTRFTR